MEPLDSLGAARLNGSFKVLPDSCKRFAVQLRPSNRHDGTCGWSVEDVTGEAFESFERFYRSEYRAVLAFAHVLTGDPGRAEEVTQEAFLAAYGSWAELDSPAAWTRRVASNKAKSWWRRRYAERRAVGRLRTNIPAVNTTNATIPEMVRRKRYFAIG